MIRHATAPPSGSIFGTRDCRSRSLDLCLACLSLFSLVAFLGAGVPTAGAACPNEAVRQQQHATHLPDCRAYEIVSPGAAKNAESLGVTTTPISADGSRVVYLSSEAISEDATTGMAPFAGIAYLATRGADGWRSEFLLDGLPHPETAILSGPLGFSPGYTGSSPDLSSHFFGVGYGSSTGFASGVYVRDPSGATELVAAGEALNTYVVGSSLDGSRQMISTPLPLAPLPCSPQPCSPPAPSGPLLYERHGGELRLVNVDEEGNLLNVSGASLASRIGPVRTSAHSPVSDDGSRIFFNSRPAEPTTVTSGQLFVRVGGAETVEVSASRHSAPQPPQEDVQFVDASRDGTIAYFTSAAQLTDDATGVGPFLYRFDLPRGAADGSLTLIAGVDHAVTTVNLVSSGGGAVADAIVSDDGARVYYHSPDDGGSLFRYDGVSGDTRQIAEGVGAVLLAREQTAQVGPSAAQITPDGGRLAFISSTGFLDGHGGQQIYVYDDLSEAIARVSTGPSEPAAPFDAYLTVHGAAGTYSEYLSADLNFLSDDGAYVFFTTAAPLVTSDLNSRDDVYRWKRGGGVSLVSSGSAGEWAVAVGGAADGSIVAFATGSDLVPRDGDDWTDFYVARVDGGFAAEFAPTASCPGDSCQGPLQPTAPAPGYGSALLQGPGQRVAERKRQRSKKRQKKRRAHSKRANAARHGAQRERGAK